MKELDTLPDGVSFTCTCCSEVFIHDYDFWHDNGHYHNPWGLTLDYPCHAESGEVWAESHFDEVYGYCDDCGGEFYHEDLVWNDDLCEDHCETCAGDHRRGGSAPEPARCSCGGRYVHLHGITEQLVCDCQVLRLVNAGTPIVLAHPLPDILPEAQPLREYVRPVEAAKVAA